MSTRVLMVSDCYAPDEVGGAERSVRLLVDGMRHIGVDAHVLTLGPRDGVAGPPHVHRRPIPNLYWPYRAEQRPRVQRLCWHVADLHNVRGRRLVADAVRRLRPSVVHTHNLAGFSTAAWAGVPAGLPVVHTLRDHYLRCPARTGWHDGRDCGPACRAAGLIRRRAARRVDAVVGVSRCILDAHLAAGFFAGTPTAVIPNAAGTAQARPRTPRRGPVRFGYLGRLSPEKGVEDLLRAQHGLPRGAYSLSVAGRGDGHTEQSLRRMAGPAVHFAGHVEPASWFAQVDVLVVPSQWQEPFGRVVVEAFAHGVPVLVARRGALPELVRHGRDGMVYDPDDVDGLRRALHRLTQDPDLLGRLTRGARARELLPVDDVVHRHLVLYRRVAAAAAGAPAPAPAGT